MACVLDTIVNCVQTLLENVQIDVYVHIFTSEFCKSRFQHTDICLPFSVKCTHVQNSRVLCVCVCVFTVSSRFTLKNVEIKTELTIHRGLFKHQ